MWFNLTQKRIQKYQLMYRKFLSAEVGGISKKIKNDFSDVVRSMEIQLRQKGKSSAEKLERLQAETKGMSRKLNTFSNLLLNDNFTFLHLEDEPLLMLKYAQIVIQSLIQNHSCGSKMRKLKQTQKGCSQNNIYEVNAALKLQNYDLKDKIVTLEKTISISNQRAKCSEEIAQAIKEKGDKMLSSYRQNFTIICNLLKKTQSNEVQLVQNNRYLKQQLQSLSIQFERYKQYFKQGPSMKEKEAKLKERLEKDYEQRLKNIIKQLEYTMRRQLDLKNDNTSNLSKSPKRKPLSEKIDKSGKAK